MGKIISKRYGIMNIFVCQNKVSLYGCKLTAQRCVCVRVANTACKRESFTKLELLQALFHNSEIITVHNDVSKHRLQKGIIYPTKTSASTVA